MSFTISPILESEVYRALEEDVRKKYAALYLPLLSPGLRPRFPLWRSTRLGRDWLDDRWGLASWSIGGIGRNAVTWHIPEDARRFESIESVMARHLAEAYRPEGVP